LLTLVERVTTLLKWITARPNRTRANGAMVAGVAKGTSTSNTGSRATGARIDTLIAIASLIDITVLLKKKKDRHKMCH